MTEHPLEFIRARGREAEASPKHPLGKLDSARISRHLTIFRPDEAAMKALLTIARARIPGLTDDETVCGVLRHNPECIWAIARNQKFNPAAPEGEGFIALLPLKKSALLQL